MFIETTAEIVARKFKMELKKYVPAYMVPGKIVTMEKFPHTPSGKIDRVGLRKTYITLSKIAHSTVNNFFQPKQGN